jgi:hypothetical protein
MATNMNTPMTVPIKMKELWFRKALNETAYGKGRPIAMRSVHHNSDRFYLTGSPPQWYNLAITTKKDKTQQKAWYKLRKVDLTTKDLAIDGMADYTRFYISIESQDVNPLSNAAGWLDDRKKTYPKIDNDLKKPRGNGKGKTATERGGKADNKEEIIAPDSDPENNNNLTRSRPDTTPQSAGQATATPNTNADEEKPDEENVEDAYTSEEEVELQEKSVVAVREMKGAKERDRYRFESREGRGIGSVGDTDEWKTEGPQHRG